MFRVQIQIFSIHVGIKSHKKISFCVVNGNVNHGEQRLKKQEEETRSNW